MKWRKSVGLGANAIWSTYPSRDWFIPNTSLAIPFPFDEAETAAARGGHADVHNLASRCNEPIDSPLPCRRRTEPASLMSTIDRLDVEAIRLIAFSGQVHVAFSTGRIDCVDHLVRELIFLLACCP